MNNQQKRVFRRLTQKQKDQIEAARKAKIAEILNGRMANDPEDFNRLKSERHRKIAERKTNNA